MHVEDSHRPPTTLRDFLRQYAMIVLSIITALGFEQAVISIHNSLQARDSQARIERELEADLADLRQSANHNAAYVAAARAALHTLFAQEKSGKSDLAAISATMLSVGLEVSMPAWQRDAWESAIANQSVNYLDLASQRRYTEIYTTSRDAADEARLLLGGDWLTRASDLNIELRHNAVDAQSGEKVLVRYLVAVEQIRQTQEALIKLIESKALPNPKG